VLHYSGDFVRSTLADNRRVGLLSSVNTQRSSRRRRISRLAV
jgi:hypothetical protein